MLALACDEDPRRLIDPDLFDRVVVEEHLQRTEARHIGHDLADHGLRLLERRHRAGQTAGLVLGDRIERSQPDRPGVGARIDATLTDQITHAIGERRCRRFHARALSPERMPERRMANTVKNVKP